MYYCYNNTNWIDISCNWISDAIKLMAVMSISSLLKKRHDSESGPNFIFFVLITKIVWSQCDEPP